jgi:23S rRNA pseudouridine1911/1915/1917 synthase
LPKPAFIRIGDSLEIPILHEDRSVLAIDKPAGWMLAPSDWDRTGRNLQLAISSSIQGGEYWARSRNLKFLRFVHRLDAETTGVILFAKTQTAIPVLSRLFETRQVEKIYFAVVSGAPSKNEWSCDAPLAQHPAQRGKMRVDKTGKPSETRFTVIQRSEKKSLIKAVPLTGRTHQIRVHLRESGFPILGDVAYGGARINSAEFPLALRAAELHYRDPFSRKAVRITAPMENFLAAFAFESDRGNKKGSTSVLPRENNR